MKSVILTLGMIALCTSISLAQNAVRFGNITEATVGLQIGKTTRITSFQGGETEEAKARYVFPSPRIASAIGVHFADMLFLGPGIAYAFQPGDDKNGYSHQVSAFGQTRLHLGSSKIRPFFDVKGGYHFASWEQTSLLFDKDWYQWDGFFIEPGLGLSFQLTEKTNLNRSLGYQFVQAGNRIEQSIMTERGQPIVNAAIVENYHRFLLSVGLT